MAHNTAFWNQLLLRSDSIGDISSQLPDAAEQLLAQLATIGEQFDRVFDPAEQFEEYVAVAFCQAVQRALQAARPAVAVADAGRKTAPALPGSETPRARKSDPNLRPTKKAAPAKSAAAVSAAQTSRRKKNK